MSGTILTNVRTTDRLIRLLRGYILDGTPSRDLMDQAADEIERLSSVASAEMKLREGNFAEIERLQAEVKDLSTPDMTVTRLAWEHERFRAALQAVAAFEPGNFRPLRDEIAIHKLATDALACSQSAESHCAVEPRPHEKTP